MKHLKILGLAAVAALAVMALVGASSASANVLCKNNTSTPCSSDYVAGETITGNSTNPTLTAEPEIICATSQVVTKITKTGGSGINATGEVTALTFKECKVNSGIFKGTACEVTSIRTPYHAEVTSGTAPNGTLDVKSGGTGNPGAKVVCGGFLSCTFSNTLFSLPITGGNPATVTASKVNLTIESGGFGCPSTAAWDATYESTTPVFVKAS
jgi:hypothetical protein